jgi:hypothetical protein
MNQFVASGASGASGGSTVGTADALQPDQPNQPDQPDQPDQPVQPVQPAKSATIWAGYVDDEFAAVLDKHFATYKAPRYSDHMARFPDHTAPAPLSAQTDPLPDQLCKRAVVPSMQLDPPGLADLAPGARLGCQYVSDKTKSDQKSIQDMSSQVAELTAKTNQLETSYAASQKMLARLGQAAQKCSAKRKFSQLVSDQIALVVRSAKHALSTCVLDQTNTDADASLDASLDASTNADDTDQILQQLERSQMLDSQSALRGISALQQVVSVLDAI